MKTSYEREKEFFDRIASQANPTPMPRETLMRYAFPKWPELFSKEMMFKLAGDLHGKKVLEVGCGEGVASVQLAYCGACVDAIDVSPVSISVAKKRAEINCQDVNFRVDNIVLSENISMNYYDIVWCDLILHHLTENFEIVIAKLYNCLKDGGLLIIREPVVYARWLKTIRSIIPVGKEYSQDEQPLREKELEILEKYFNDYRKKYFRILARANRLTNNLIILRNLARIDNIILCIPGTSRLAGNVVICAKKNIEFL